MPPSDNLCNSLNKHYESSSTTLPMPEENLLENQAAINAVNVIPDMENHLTGSRLKSLSLDDGVVEPKTGFKFPTFLSCDKYQKGGSGAGSGQQELAGVGDKSICIIKLKTIKIYAFGFYINPECLKSSLGEKYSIVPPAKLKQTSSFYDDLLRHELEMTVRLIVYRKGLSMTMVRSAFEASLKNRLRKIKGTDEDDGLRVFCSYFKQLNLTPGSVIDFHWHPGGQLLTEVDGCVLGTIFSQTFCRALFDLYIGDPPVSWKARQEIGEKLGYMLRN